MQNLLEYILKNITKYPEEIKITTTTDKDLTQIYNVKVNPDDMGIIIGKKGKVISSIRKLLKVKAIKNRLRFQLYLTGDV